MASLVNAILLTVLSRHLTDPGPIGDDPYGVGTLVALFKSIGWFAVWWGLLWAASKIIQAGAPEALPKLAVANASLAAIGVVVAFNWEWIAGLVGKLGGAN